MANPSQPMSGKTGDAPINRSGHTASPKHGADSNAKAIMRPDARDERVK